MASRMLHFVMASELLQELGIKDRNRFLVGALLPDASSHPDGSYDGMEYTAENYSTKKPYVDVNCSLFDIRLAYRP